METIKTNKNWGKPKLIVLSHATPDESVLTHCKTMNPNQAVTGQNATIQDTCAKGPENQNCSNCQSRAVGS